MANRSNQVITLEQVDSLKLDSKPIVWKDLGVYLDKKLIIEPNTDVDPSSFGSQSLVNQSIKYKVCKNCNRPVGSKSLSSHYTKCLEMRTKKKIDEDDLPMRKRKKLDAETSSIDSRNSTPIPASSIAASLKEENSVTISAATGKPKKKYKKSQTQKEKEAANAAAQDSSDKKKKKNQTKAPKSSKNKGPVDVEKQCGVPLPNGGFCARSLTCKTHSMGAKRMVPGRSAPYDVLLQQYQKRNQAKLAANNALAMQKKENEELNADSTSDTNANRILDPDDETYLVLEGLSKNQPIPLERKVILPVRNRHKFLYMREAYANALIINSNSNSSSTQGGETTLANQAISGSIGGLQGRCALVNVDSKKVENDSQTQSSASIAGEMYQVRAPSKEILVTAQHNVMNQQLFQQQVMKMQQQQMLMRQKQAKTQQASPSVQPSQIQTSR